MNVSICMTCLPIYSHSCSLILYFEGLIFRGDATETLGQLPGTQFLLQIEISLSRCPPARVRSLNFHDL